MQEHATVEQRSTTNFRNTYFNSDENPLLKKHPDASMGIYFKAKGTPSFLSNSYQLHVKQGVPHSREANKYW